MDPYSFCGWHVRCSHRSDRSTLRILRWIWLYAQSVLCPIQPCSLCYFNGTVCASICTRCESSVWLGAKHHVAAYCTYLIMSAVGNHQHTSCNPLHNGTAQGTQTTTLYSTQCLLSWQSHTRPVGQRHRAAPLLGRIRKARWHYQTDHSLVTSQPQRTEILRYQALLAAVEAGYVQA